MAISDLLKTLNQSADQSLYADATEGEREVLLAALGNLQNAVESPIQATWRAVFAPNYTIALRLGIDMSLFDPIEKGSNVVAVEQLAARVGADSILVTRIIRLLAGMNLFKEIDLGTYKRLSLANAYVTGSPLAEAIIMMSSESEVFSQLPSYFADKGFKNPSDAYDAPFQFARRTKQTPFEWMETKPRLQEAFNKTMVFVRKNRGPEWFDFYPIEEKLARTSKTSDSDVLVVDVGGGLGQVLLGLKEKFPNLPGELVVQDLPNVISSITDLPSGIQAQAHDFFEPQPLKGAKAYYLRAILHDWPEKQALQILKQIAAAMDEDSVVLVNEVILPEKNVPIFQSHMDFMMMSSFSSLERTEKQWRDLLGKAGLDVVGIWESDAKVVLASSLIEAKLKKSG